MPIIKRKSSLASGDGGTTALWRWQNYCCQLPPITYKDEIKSRPKNEWIMSKKEKDNVKKGSKKEKQAFSKREIYSYCP